MSEYGWSYLPLLAIPLGALLIAAGWRLNHPRVTAA